MQPSPEGADSRCSKTSCVSIWSLKSMQPAQSEHLPSDQWEALVSDRPRAGPFGNGKDDQDNPQPRGVTGRRASENVSRLT